MVKAVFELVGSNPPTALIVGGILLFVFSVIIDQIEPTSAQFLRSTGWALIILGAGLHIIWLLPRLR